MANRFITFFVALLAVAVLGAVAVAVASAEELPAFLSEAKEEADNFTGTSGKSTLAMSGGVLKEMMPAKSKWEGTVEAGGMKATYHIDLEGVKLAGVTACTGLSEASGVILLLGAFSLVYDALGTVDEETLGVAALFLVDPAHFECSTKLYVIGGELLCLIKPLEVATKEFSVRCEGEKGTPKETKYWVNGQEKKVEDPLKIAENEGTAAEASNSQTLTMVFANNMILRG